MGPVHLQLYPSPQFRACDFWCLQTEGEPLTSKRLSILLCISYIIMCLQHLFSPSSLSADGWNCRQGKWRISTAFIAPAQEWHWQPTGNRKATWPPMTDVVTVTKEIRHRPTATPPDDIIATMIYNFMFRPIFLSPI